MRTLIILSLSLGILSCCTTSENVAIPPLPVEGGGIAFSDLVQRMKSHANTAHDASYINDWDNVIKMSVELEKDAAYLVKSVDIPQTVKTSLNQESSKLTQFTKSLREAAVSSDEEKVARSMNQIKHLIWNLKAK